MTIYINEQQIDFTLEDGERISGIYESIRSFLLASGYLIYSFSVDGVETDPEDTESWNSKEIASIEKIEVTALTEEEYRLSGLLTISEFINFITRAVSGNEFDSIHRLMDEFPSVIRNIPILVKGDQGKLIKDHLEKVMNESGLLDNSFDESYRNDFLREIGKISELLESASREIEDPLQELDKSMKALEKLNPSLSDVSILLQTGKDREAMDIVISLTEILQKIVRLLSLFETDNIDMDNLNSILSELAEAFGAEDSVLIGDLLEYEVSPLVEQLSAAVESIKNPGG